jgi:hypothetical protein
LQCIAISSDYEERSRSARNPLQIFVHVTMPLIAPGSCRLAVRDARIARQPSGLASWHGQRPTLPVVMLSYLQTSSIRLSHDQHRDADHDRTC